MSAKLIEFKLHAGQFPYFVKDVIGGVELGGKRYGISQDTHTCYLPDTVVSLSQAEFTAKVKAAEIYKVSEDGESIEFMDDSEKEAFCRNWLDAHSHSLS